MNWHLLPPQEIMQLLHTNEHGLDDATAKRRILEYGLNELLEKKKTSPIMLFLKQFSDVMIVILIIAAVISGLIGDLIDTAIILGILLMNAMIGFIQEYRSEHAITALKNMSVAQSRVLRDGKLIDSLSSHLVPGDIISVNAGNIIPADIRFISTHSLKIDESALTGESGVVEKITEELPTDEYSLGDRINMGFKGSHVKSGHGIGCIVATGMNTELGKIAKLIQDEPIETPLQRRLSSFGKKLSLIIIMICVVIFAFGALRGEQTLQLLLTSISLAVAAIPEGLPAIISITLALGAKKLAESHTLIRTLPSVETLGSVTYICTDKTGTLTQNIMSVQEIIDYSTDQERMLFQGNHPLFCAMALNNDAEFSMDNTWAGDPTEIALAEYAVSQSYHRISLEHEFPRIAEIPFDPNRKFMTTVHRINDSVITITKGALDSLLDKLSIRQQHSITEIQHTFDEMSGKGYRVLGYAIRVFDELPAELLTDNIESDLTLLGFACMSDPPAIGVKEAINECKQAGIIPVMITGDYEITAKAIATELGILESGKDLLINGRQLASMSESELEEIVESIKVYARVNPEQKLKIVECLQKKGHIVAMTGDGVNDAPALKHADIGIAMGLKGTDVAKESSHMILLDDNFSSIVQAVKHGRRIFDNILKFIKYLMTGNSGEIWTIFLAPFFGLPMPLLAIHILWINLITDGLPGLALASESNEPNIMNRMPREPNESIFSRGMGLHIVWVGFLICILTLGMQAWALHEHFANWQTMAFTVLCFSQLGHVLAIRSTHESVFTIGIWSNNPLTLSLILTISLQLLLIYVPWCNDIFKTQPLSIFELGITFCVSSLTFWAVEIEKWILRKNMYARHSIVSSISIH